MSGKSKGSLLVTISRIRHEEGDDSPNLIEPFRELAERYHESGEFDKEIEARRILLELRLQNSDSELAYVADTLRDLRFLFDEAGAKEEAKDVSIQQLGLYVGGRKEESHEVMLLMSALQYLRAMVGALEEEKNFRAAFVLRDQLLRADEAFFDKETRRPAIEILFDLIYNLNLNEFYGDAREIAADVLKMCKKLYGADDPRSLQARELFNASSSEHEFEEDDDELEEIGARAIQALNVLAEAQRSAKRFELEAANRRRAVELWYETYGEPETWTVRLMIGAQSVLERLIDCLERLERTEELAEARKKLAAVEKMIDDYKNMTSEEALTDIRRMIEK